MEKPSSNPWKTLLSTAGLGVLGIAVGIYMYFDLAEWEKTGGTRVMNSTIAFFYKILGKNGVLAVALLAGAVLVSIGIWDFTKQLRNRKSIPLENTADKKVS